MPPLAVRTRARRDGHGGRRDGDSGAWEQCFCGTILLPPPPQKKFIIRLNSNGKQLEPTPITVSPIPSGNFGLIVKSKFMLGKQVEILVEILNRLKDNKWRKLDQKQVEIFVKILKFLPKIEQNNEKCEIFV